MSHSAPETIYNEVFISYSRKDIDFAKRLVQAIYDSGRENVWIDWEDIEYAEDWWQKIQSGIESTYNFIFILTPDSVQSEVCYNEIEHAVKSGKRIIPIVHIEVTDKLDLAKMHPAISKHNWLPFKASDDFDAGMQQLFETIEKDLAHVRFHTRLQTRAREWEQFERNEAYLLSTGELTEAQAWLARAELEDKDPTPTALHHEYIDASQVTEDERQAEAERIARRVKNFQRASIGLGIIAIVAFIAALVSAYLISAANESAKFVQTQIAELEAIIPGATQGALWEVWSSQLDIEVRSQIIRDGGPRVERDFDGVSMVLVPPGCFMMGSEDGYSIEQPVREVCFNESFWIDKYEVTNEQYGTIGCADRSSEPDQPRNCVSWVDALTHCQSRGGTLPTEAQWEYAARGTDSLIYPWGDEFIGNNVVFIGNSGNKTAPVGSRPTGASWVGAMDMSGNLSEWTSTIYDTDRFLYPYDADDGREDLNETSRIRAVRGAHYFSTTGVLRSSNRSRDSVNNEDRFTGFRCVRSYEE